jgi:PAS domain S-box-containing protein
MEHAMFLTNVLPGSVADLRRSAVRRAIALSVLVLGITVALCIGLYNSERRAFQVLVDRPEVEVNAFTRAQQTEMLARVDHLAFSLNTLAILGGLGSLVPLYVAATRGQRRFISDLEKKVDELRTTATRLQGFASDVKRSKDEMATGYAELEERVKTLSSANERLQEELNKRNQAERAMTQRRQELESSKSVLELHVQARTKQLESLQRRYEMILNSAGEGICSLDIEGKSTFVNPTVAKLTGRPIEELIGKTEQELFFPHGRNGNSLKTATPLNPNEQIFYRHDGNCFPVELVKTPINENGRVVGSVLVFKDITERKRVEESLSQKAAELARSNSELEQFAFVASHDLQEPLRKIQAFGDRLKAKCESAESPEVKDYLDRMQGAAGRMRTLISDLLTFSRVIRSSEPCVPVDLSMVAREVLGDLEVRIEKSGAKIEISALPTIDADAMQMRQLLLNLLSNALKFQPPGATPLIKVSSRLLNAPSGEQLCELTVQDNGIGFDEKYVDKMFAVFQRLHGRTEYEGTGIGLAVCRRIVDRHHGNILARSQSGQGATFMITLPVRQQKAPTSA